MVQMVRTECSTGFLEGFPSSAEELSRGLVGIMPHGQTRECTRGWTCGIRLLQCPLSTCSCVRTEVDGLRLSFGASPVWARHVSIGYKRDTPVEVFCQVAYRFGVHYLTTAF